MNSIKNNKEIRRSDRENMYNIYKTNNDLKNVTLDYNEYKMLWKILKNLEILI